jgi:hypothetical protein
MVRRVTKKQRGVIKRRQKKIILVGAEGDNQTERNYLTSFNSKQNEYRIIIATGIHTDPEGVVNDLVKSAKKSELDEDYGDMKVCLMDVDYLKNRKIKLQKAIEISEKENVKLCLSNPCFEIWFLLHYRYSTRQYLSNNEIVKELQQYIPDYKKSKDIFDTLWPNLDEAIKNAKKLEENHIRNNVKSRLEKIPSSEVYGLIEILLKDKNKGGDA